MPTRVLPMASGVTLVGMLVALTIAAALAALVVSVLPAARGAGDKGACAQRLHQVSLALSAYTSDYDGVYPPAVDAEFASRHTRSPRNWLALLSPYLSSGPPPYCPSRTLVGRLAAEPALPQTAGYGYNGRLTTASAAAAKREYGKHETMVGNPSLTVGVFDTRAGILARMSPDTGTAREDLHGLYLADFVPEILAQREGARRHGGGANYAFADGHMKWLRPEMLKTGRTCDGLHPGSGI